MKGDAQTPLQCKQIAKPVDYLNITPGVNDPRCNIIKENI